MLKKLSIVLTLFLIAWLCCCAPLYSQGYPKVMGYASVVHPIVSLDASGTTYNFSGFYTVGFPFGINILKSDHIGYSFELTPFIRSENGTDKTSNFLFHPGILFRFPKAFTIIGRMAFETNGRYGLTPVFSKVIVRKTNLNYFLAIPVPVRFGNDKPASIGLSFQAGISF